jgi:chromosome condensin MukBEF MukE localization factor
VGACSSALENAEAWRTDFAPTLLDGYEDFRADLNGAEEGFFIFSYRIPTGVVPETVIAKLREKITTQFPCYRVLEATESRLVLRCPGGRMRSGYYWDEEYRLIVDGTKRRVFQFAIDSVKRSEYSDAVQLFDRVAAERN